MPKIKIIYGMSGVMISTSDNVQIKIDDWIKQNDVTILSAQSSIAARSGFSSFPTITTILYEDNSVKL